MLHPTIDELTQGKYNRYELALAAAKCARIITDEYVEQRDNAEHPATNGKENGGVDRELRDEKAVKVAKKALTVCKKDVKKTNKLAKKYQKLNKKATKQDNAKKLAKAQAMLEKLNAKKAVCESAFAEFDVAATNLAATQNNLVATSKTANKGYKGYKATKTKAAKLQATFAEKKAKLARRLESKKDKGANIKLKPMKKDIKKAKKAIAKALKHCKKNVKKNNKLAKLAKKAQKKATKKATDKKINRAAKAAAAVTTAIEKYKTDAIKSIR